MIHYCDLCERVLGTMIDADTSFERWWCSSCGFRPSPRGQCSKCKTCQLVSELEEHEKTCTTVPIPESELNTDSQQ